MSPDEFALMQAIRANPADDLPRLVYADFLEERGDEARAEFIRLQCSGADPARAATLLAEHRERWDEAIRLEILKSYPDAQLEQCVSGWTYRRGMITALDVSPAAFQQMPELPRRIGPIECLRIHVDHDEYPDGTDVSSWDFSRLKVVDLDGSRAWDFFESLYLRSGRVAYQVPVLHMRSNTLTFSGFVRLQFNRRWLHGQLNPVIIYSTDGRNGPSTIIEDAFGMWSLVQEWAETYLNIADTVGMTVNTFSAKQIALIPSSRMRHLVRYYQLAGLPPPAELAAPPYPQEEREQPPKRNLLNRAVRWFRRSRP
jgi:uncharacterized protein (TIGR02996 family)